MPLRQSISCYFKYLLSYTKKEWTVDDYPIRYDRKNSADSGDPNLMWSAEDFFPAIPGYDFHGIFVSDESSVFDFGEDETETIAAINSRYGLQLTTLGDGNIVHILQLIKRERKLL